jgi:hypothetical protein
MAIGSPLSPVIANFTMENFEEVLLDQAVHNPPTLPMVLWMMLSSSGVPDPDS